MTSNFEIGDLVVNPWMVEKKGTAGLIIKIDSWKDNYFVYWGNGLVGGGHSYNLEKVGHFDIDKVLQYPFAPWEEIAHDHT